ncbi:MAG: aspartate--ammonia ligase [Firmicutes bacterium]|nr:aspartate--ammonia ligase [Bacillota bacterium]
MASKIFIPDGYRSPLDVYETQRVIDFIKHTFQRELSVALNLKRVSAPLVVMSDLGFNDNLSGVERPVRFDVPAVGQDSEVVQSLAKWKRYALKKYDFSLHEGLLTDMNAIRRDEALDNLHSIYVDQWDWEMIIDGGDRNEAFLHETVERIVSAIARVGEELHWRFPKLTPKVERDIFFITSQELEDAYPDLTPEEREHELLKAHHTAFISQIGGALRSGKPHGSRSPDYDDWSLNGDLLFWDETLQCPIEISSMGIRVDGATLLRQLALANCEDRKKLYFHKLLLENRLPLTIGGGIGQSRLCMFLMGSCHIGEVQAAVWDRETEDAFEKRGIVLL